MKEYPFYLHNTLVLRTSLLPYHVLKESTEDADLLIRRLWNNVYVKNGILLASYTFYAEIEKYLLDNNNQSSEKKKKIQDTFFKYFIRICSRSTPFGLFSLVTPISIDDLGRQIVEPNDQRICIKAMLHSQILNNIVEFLTKRFREHTLFKGNRSLTEKEGNYIITVPVMMENRSIYIAKQIESNEIIEFLYREKDVELAYPRLVEKLVQEFPYYSPDDISAFLNDCIEQGIIVNILSLVSRGEKSNNERILNDILRTYSKEPHHELKLLLDIFEIVQTLTAEDVLMDSFERISGILDTLGIQYSVDKLLFVNAYREGIIDVGMKGIQLANLMKTAMDVLSRFISWKNSDGWFDNFKKLFKNIYGDEMISFSIVFDPLIGLNYPLSNKKDTEKEILLTELHLPNNSKPDTSSRHDVNFWYEKYLECVMNNQEELVIEDRELKRYPPRFAKENYTFSMFASIVEDPSGNSQSPYILYKNASAGSATAYLGRFSSSNDEIYSLCKEIATYEECSESNMIHAEIGHIPDPKIADIIFHNSFHKYEIPYLVNTDTNFDFTIDIEDLFLGIQNDEFVIYSKKHGKYVNPILSNAYNFSLSEHAAFMFLCDFQHRKSLFTPHLALGKWSTGLPFLPRIRYRNIIFSPKIWNIDLAKFAHLIADSEDAEGFVEALRIAFPTLPKLIQVGNSDQILVINLDDLNSVRLLFKFCRKKYHFGNKKVKISESFQPKSVYSNEIIFSYNYDGK